MSRFASLLIVALIFAVAFVNAATPKPTSPPTPPSPTPSLCESACHSYFTVASSECALIVFPAAKQYCLAFIQEQFQACNAACDITNPPNVTAKKIHTPIAKTMIAKTMKKDNGNYFCEQTCQNVASVQSLACYTTDPDPYGALYQACVEAVQTELQGCDSLCGETTPPAVVARVAPKSVQMKKPIVSKDNSLCDEGCQAVATAASAVCYTNPLTGMLCLDAVQVQLESCEAVCDSVAASRARRVHRLTRLQ